MNQHFLSELGNAPVHRIRVFRQQTNDLYLGLSLSSKEFTDLSQESPLESSKQQSETFWREISETLKNYDLVVSPETLSNPLTKSFFKVQPHLSSVVAKRLDSFNQAQKVAFLLGDAALTANFLTASGLNTGLIAADFLVRRLLSSTIESDSTITEYGAAMQLPSQIVVDRAKPVAVPDWKEVEDLCFQLSQNADIKVLQMQFMRIGFSVTLPYSALSSDKYWFRSICSLTLGRGDREAIDKTRQLGLEFRV